LVYYGSSWHLLAYCLLRQGPRDFRVDRLVKLEITDCHFEPREPYEEFIKRLTYGGELEEVIVQIKGEAARYIVNQKYYQGFVSEVDKGDSKEMKFLVPHLEYFSRWLAMLGDSVTIVSPDKLLTIMQKRVEELRRNYE
ncbi:MAG: WYL domain-containing protein, partial [Rhodobacteraceae bacterium]|nr:WYL domain-containing protein [Paracoccaceae bacterium]